MNSGVILALDLGVSTGFAKGRPGEMPRSGVITLKKPKEFRAVSFGNLIAFLNEDFLNERPALVAKEAMLPLQGFLRVGNAEATVRLHAGLHAIVEAMCQRFGVECIDERDSTIRKHFIGKGRMGTRADTKAEVIKRCHLLGMMPRDCHDDNRADAIALFDFMCSSHGKVIPGDLHMFGETA